MKLTTLRTATGAILDPTYADQLPITLRKSSVGWTSLQTTRAS